jgi:hypothetical protein
MADAAPHLSPDDSGRVTAMAATLPPEQNLADEPGLMLALHHRRFPAADVALLAPYVAAKARELRAAFGLDDPREAVAGLFFFLAMASATFFFCFVAPEEAQAHALAPTPELPGPFAWLIATATVVIVTLTIWGLSTVAIEWRQMRDLCEPLAPITEHLSLNATADGGFWSREQWAAYEARVRELRRHAWHVYIAMVMSGDLDRAPPRRLTGAEMGDAIAFAENWPQLPVDMPLYAEAA